MKSSEELEAAVRQAVQAVLDASDDPGWQIAQFVICMGLERVRPGGSIEFSPWLWSPDSQPDWMTSGLLDSATDLHADSEEESDSD